MKKSDHFFRRDNHARRKPTRIFNLLLIFFISSFISINASTYSQTQKLTLNLTNASLVDVFDAIEKNSEMRIAYDASEIEKFPKINVIANNESIEDILTNALKSTDLSFVVMNKYIVITKQKSENTSKQQQTITGVVMDEGGVPLLGVTVVVKGTTNGTVTNAEGKYTLSNVASGDILQFSFIGFESQEVAVGTQSEVDVNLVSRASELEEIVVVGYGTMRKKDLTGSIMQIRPDKIENENPKTVQDILRGTPGLNVGFDGSAKGGGSMQIRGQRSVYTDGGHNDPLLILDGMIFYGELSEINPDDIAQIDVLKDASAAAVYGAKSANGVIIITTKKGKLGKPKINFSTSLGLSTMGVNHEVFGPEGYMQYREDWYTSATYGLNEETGVYGAYQSSYSDKPGYFVKPTSENLAKYGLTLDDWRGYTTNGEATDDEIWATRLLLQGNSLENYLIGKTYDWYDHSFRTGVNQDYNISVSGANDRMNYYMSVGYLSSEGVAVGNDYRAIRSNLKLDGKVTDWLNIGANVNFQDRSDGDLAVDWARQKKNSPYATYADEDGNPVVHPMGDGTAFKGYNYDFDHQYMELEKGYTVLNSIFTAKVKLPFNVTYSFNAAPRYQFFYDRYFESSEHPDWSPIDHGVNREQAKRFDWSLNNTINWDYIIAIKNHVNITLVQEAEERKYWQDRIEARNILPTDALGFHETKTGDKDRSDFNSNDTHETADGMLARLFYSFDERYMFTGSIRRDGYSAFGLSNPRATFYSVAFAWTFTNEALFNWEPMSMGKLRFSWGQNGNRSLSDPYVALADLGSGAGKTQGYVDINGNYIQYRYMSVNRLANPFLQWEKTTSWNIGLDYGFLDNRITGTVDYYVMPTNDMIMNQSLPGFSGVGSITSNLGEVENKGFEFSINSRNIKNSIFEWNTTLGLSVYKNTIKHLYYEYEDIIDADGNIIGSKESDDISNKWFIGQAISAIWNYNVTGIWQVDEIEEAAKYGQRPGDVKVANNYTEDDIVNNDGTVTPVYNDKDKEFLGQTAPPIHWSLRNDFTFSNNISFSFNIYSYWGHKSLETAYLNQDNGTSEVTNALNLYEKEYWMLDNPTNEYGRLDARGPAGVTSPGKLYDRSFIRLENITLGYTLPEELTARWSIEKVKIYGGIRNVAVWSKDNWEYWDPETGSIAPRTYTFGLSLTL